MTRFRNIAPRLAFGAALLAAVFSGAAPAIAAMEGRDFPTAIAADAADVMAKYGGVVIDVESRFAAPSPNFFGCGVVKHEAKVSADHRTFNYTPCAVPVVKVYPPTPSTGIAGQGRP